jgi:serine protease DegQ
MTAEIAQALSADKGGVVIRGVVRSGPADRAGIQPRDVVMEIDGKPMLDTPALLTCIANLSPGAPVKVKVWRDRKVVDVDVTVGKRPKAQQ